MSPRSHESAQSWDWLSAQFVAHRVNWESVYNTLTLTVSQSVLGPSASSLKTDTHACLLQSPWPIPTQTKKTFLFVVVCGGGFSGMAALHSRKYTCGQSPAAHDPCHPAYHLRPLLSNSLQTLFIGPFMMLNYQRLTPHHQRADRKIDIQIFLFNSNIKNQMMIIIFWVIGLVIHWVTVRLGLFY